MSRRRMGIAAVVVALIGSLIGAPGASASTITVNCAKQSLQAKINKATAGSTLLVTGTCTGDFVVGKDLTLKGNPSATLDGGGVGTTLTITGTHSTHLRSLRSPGGRPRRVGASRWPVVAC
jgi:nitrous oxidase accessory protein NosD